MRSRRSWQFLLLSCDCRRSARGTIVEILRHDFPYDETRDEWRVMMG
jgi:hypothetical protein